MITPKEPFGYTESDRSILAKMIVKLFENWQLKTEDQLSLLGLPASNKATLAHYRKGKPLAPNRDLLERVSILLGIHKSLRLLFPHNRELAYAWMSTHNRAFEGLTPIETIGQRGFYGLLMIRTYLNRASNQ